MNPSQARAARAMLKLGVREVAELAKVTANTVSRVEQDDPGPRGPQPVTIDAIKRVYQERGIIFLKKETRPTGAKASGSPDRSDFRHGSLRRNGIDVAKLKNAIAVAESGREGPDGIPFSRRPSENKSFSIVCQGSSSCDEDRLGLSEQPSEDQCRARHLSHEDGHTVLLPSVVLGCL